MSEPPQLIVGTAGHIDHGKSRLVRALTGTDPDRLPEEKARGMTIDLGFAHARIDGCEVWFVDVPGHERFIRNMVAGASGVDAALLTVAADDSVMPQTREHAELLSLLGVRRCVVALTKMDLVDEGWADAVQQEVSELLAALELEAFRFVRTSTQTGRGLDELRAALAELARARPGPQAEGYRWFRLPIDRAFNVAGRGTVVTGSVLHGRLRRDEELELWPAGRRVRVRELQTHHQPAPAVAGRLRLAVNLAGVGLAAVGRGCELASPGYLEATRRLEVWLAWLRMPGKLRRQRLRLRLHIATSEVPAELRLLHRLQADSLPGQFGQLLVARPIVAAWGQRFVLRDQGGLKTLGGGQVLRPRAWPWTADVGALQALRSGAPARRLEQVIRSNEWSGCSGRLLATRAGLPDEHAAAAACAGLLSERRVCLIGGPAARLFVHRSHLEALGRHLTSRLADHLSANPRLPGVPRSEWPGWMPRACPARQRAALADWLIDSGVVRLSGGHVLPPGQVGALSPADQALLERMLGEFHERAFQPPALAELSCRTPGNEKRLRELVQLAVAGGKLVRLADGLWLHADRWAELRARLVAEIRARGPLTVSQIRTLLHSSRKYVVPLVEQLDALGITRRLGDRRTLGPKSSR